MKIAIWILVGLAVLTPLVLFLVQRWRQQRAERDGVVIYATVLSTEQVKRFGKELPMMKLLLWLQEPDGSSRQVTISGRIEKNQAPKAGSRLPIVIDPKNPKRVYPAGVDAVKRITLTGPRRERRALKSQGRRGAR